MTVKDIRNGKIGFWKFMFSLLIVAYHVASYHNNSSFCSGYIGVEFFFLVSGYYLCKKCLNYKSIKSSDLGIETFNFIFNKIKKLVPYILVLWIMGIPVSIFIDKFTPYNFITAFSNTIFVPNFDYKLYVIYGITWYIIAMLVVEMFLFPILIKYRKNYAYIFSYLISFLLLSYLMLKYGNISDPWRYSMFTYKGILRAFLDINIGICIYSFIDKFKHIKLTDFSKFTLTIIEIVGYLLVFYLSSKQIYRYEFLMLIILTICLTITFSNEAYLVEFSNNKLFYYLEKLTIPIYINQFIFIKIISYIINKFSLVIPINIIIIINILISIVFAFITNKIISIVNNNKKSIKSIFIVD